MQTIIAVPIKVYEKSGPQGAVKAVIRAVPVAVLKPVIGATEAVSKTLMGIENSLDPSRGIQIKRKYKQPDL
jgi:autophagy-related protein 2